MSDPVPWPVQVPPPQPQFGRAPEAPDALSNGITSGPGNQGTTNQAHLRGHAGTAASQAGSPRALRGGMPQVTT